MAHAPTVIGLLATVALLLVLTGLAWRYRHTPGARAFGVLQALSAVWAALTVLGLTRPPGALRLRIWGITTALSLLVVVVWFGFILSYTGRDRWLSPRRFAPLAAPLGAGAGAYVVVPDWPLLVADLTQATIGAGTVVRASIGPLGGLLGLYIYLVFIAGIALVLKTVLEGPGLFVGQALALALGSVVTFVASFLAILGVPVRGYPITQVALGVQSLLWSYAVFGQQFLRVVPAVAEIGDRAVVDDLDDGVLVVDTGGTVTRANARVRSYLDEGDLAGRPVGPLLDRMGVSDIEDLPAQFRRGSRTYRTTASTVTNWRGGAIGHAIVIRDVTSLVRRGQRLQVLNRVLRHNVRNDMNVVLGIGDRLRERGENGLASMGETLAQKAADLTAISEKATEIEGILDEGMSVETVDVPGRVEVILESLADDHPEATVTTSLEPATVRTDPRILGLVLEEVVGNALEHAGPAPTVEVVGTRTEDGARIAVTDDGPGIPRIEIDPIAAGEETDLDHASSLGLWMVHWGVRSLGGDLDITTTEDGSTVAVSVPDTEVGGP
ncbi:MAG: histidine kinase N-terminal 7TM domain-containing protein [Halobacteriales archaeon]